jgi:hypothetical protein
VSGEFVSWKRNIKHMPFVDPQLVLFNKLYIKLVLMKHFVKALDKNGISSDYLGLKFRNISDAKLKIR